MNFSFLKSNLLFVLSLLFFAINVNAQLAPVSIECVNTDSNTGTYIQWTTPPDCTSADIESYNIYYAQDINDAFVLVAEQTNPNFFNTNYTLDVDSGQAFLDEGTENFFYVTYTCNGEESLASAPVSNQGLPIVELTKVTVAAGFVNIEWTPLTNSNVGGYVIGQVGQNGVLPLDTIMNPMAGFYSDFTADPDNESESYAVFAIDFCENFEVVNSNFHTTIHLESTVGGCNSVLTFGWNHYEGWETLNEYVIYESDIEGLPGEPIDTIPATQNTFEYLLSNASEDLHFIVEAVGEHLGNIVRSSSNQFTINASTPSLPSEMNLYYASVISGITDEVYLIFETTTAGSSVQYKLERGVVSENDLQSSLIVENNGDAIHDEDAKPNEFSYYYRISATDECDSKIETNYTRTIYLSHQDNFNQTITLSWNEFELEGATILEYELLRFDEINVEPTIIATFTPNDAMTFTDDVSAIESESEGFYKYQVKAIYQKQRLSGVTETLDSFSNRREVTKNSQIKDVPTAFRPNGVNNVFKPEIQFPNADNYSMLIMNRWGEKVFESNDPAIGWNGLVEGVLAPQGVYAYIIRMESFNSRELIRKGTVLLVR